MKMEKQLASVWEAGHSPRRRPELGPVNRNVDEEAIERGETVPARKSANSLSTEILKQGRNARFGGSWKGTQGHPCSPLVL